MIMSQYFYQIKRYNKVLTNVRYKSNGSVSMVEFKNENDNDNLPTTYEFVTYQEAREVQRCCKGSKIIKRSVFERYD